MGDLAELGGLESAQRGLRPVQVMHLPCKIHHDGAADVEAYFRPTETDKKSGTIVDEKGDMAQIREATFRGRKLLGAELTLPEKTQGFVLEKEDGTAPGEPEHWECQAVFDRIVYWNFDRVPSEVDETRRWADWLEVSRAINLA
ncbi:Ribonuclease H2 subunit C [Hondaea fermentalgiana]|uniref:Ribonuclease H2 subunit C n=1 Tax=Hondaea fermentalgiana TaxID=2315210 RepID=A0A2R5GUU5_9STRA|nr:Ribonuclease H2 subunit C [Hondaea fermentalgiana]|eukprot:GBG34632.1 Ribonuclease H2 subunit C [Hondaea fermentalgiana]